MLLVLIDVHPSRAYALVLLCERPVITHLYEEYSSSKNFSNPTLGKSLRREIELLNQLHKMASPFDLFNSASGLLPPAAILHSEQNELFLLSKLNPTILLTSKPCGHYKVIRKASSASHAHHMARR